MASQFDKQDAERQKALLLFRSGNSKAEIGRELGKDKKQVAKMLAEAIRAHGHGR